MYLLIESRSEAAYFAACEEIDPAVNEVSWKEGTAEYEKSCHVKILDWNRCKWMLVSVFTALRSSLILVHYTRTVN